MSLYLSTRSSARAVIQCTTRWQSSSSTGQAGSKKSSWRLNRSLVFPILLASAVSSLAINVRNSRDDLRLLEDEHAAQLSVLHDLIKRLRAGENVPQPQLLKEYERVGIIKREGVHEGRPSMHISWRETLFGRKKEQVDLDIEDRELADIEKAISQADQEATRGGKPGHNTSSAEPISTPTAKPRLTPSNAQKPIGNGTSNSPSILI